VLGAVLITLLQSGVSLMSNSWLIYVGVLFIAMVTFAPAGLSGIIVAHQPLWRTGRLSRLTVPYLRLLPAGIATVAGFIGLVELLSFLTIGAEQGKHLVLFGSPIDATSAWPWTITGALLLVGGVWLHKEARSFSRVWEAAIDDVKDARA
jgi:branched-chain amino acid transport system permease protein